jgi:Ca-activated chloride channel family protein
VDELTIGGVTFGEPWFLALLAAMPLLLLIGVVGAWSRRRAARRFGVNSGVRNWRRLIASLVVVLAVAGMALAAARPQWGERPNTLRREGIDLAVAIDVSLSMLSRDVEPSRLDRAKDEVDKLFASLRGDRVALITFAGDATVRFPLTTDIDAARQIVRGISVEYEPGFPAPTRRRRSTRRAPRSTRNDRPRGR